MDDLELQSILEALLFVAGEPVSLDRLCGVLEGVERERVLATVRNIRDRYDSLRQGMRIVEVGGGYEMVTAAEAAPWIRRLSAAKGSSRLSKPALETLAIIAYKQPLTRPEIEAIRGVDGAGVVKTLMDRRLVRIVGRKEVPGRPMMFGTTREFLRAFGLNDLSDLPTLRDFADIAKATDAFQGDADIASGGPSASVPLEAAEAMPSPLSSHS